MYPIIYTIRVHLIYTKTQKYLFPIYRILGKCFFNMTWKVEGHSLIFVQQMVKIFEFKNQTDYSYGSRAYETLQSLLSRRASGNQDDIQRVSREWPPGRRRVLKPLTVPYFKRKPSTFHSVYLLQSIRCI